MKTHLLLLASLSVVVACRPQQLNEIPANPPSNPTPNPTPTRDAGAPPPPSDAGIPEGGPTDSGTPIAYDGGVPFTYDGGVCTPIPPRALMDFTVPPVTRTVTLASGDDLQAALDAAQPGDELVLPAGAVYSGSFVLRPKSSAGWITVRSSGVANLPPLGARVDPTRDASSMARIESSVSGAPAIATQGNAGQWRFIGIEVGIAPSVSLVYNLVELGDGTQATFGALPHDIVIDRCWIHGNDTGDARRGIALNGSSIGVIGSDIDNFKEQGADSQALGGWNGAGPFTIVNNYLEGAGETVLFGGADPKVPNLVASDITLLHNTLTKRLTWKSDDPSYGGVAYVVKNDLEFKNAQRVWVEGNIIERSWVMGQVGYAVLFTPRNQDGTAPWSTVQDITIVNNIVRHAAGAVNLLSTDNDQPSQLAQRIRVANDLFYDIGTSQWGSGTKAFQFVHGPGTASCLDYQHLTADNMDTSAAVGDSAVVADQVTFSNNIFGHGTYGFFGSAVGEGTVALTTYFTNWMYAGNLMYGGGAANRYPSNNQFPADLASVGFVDAANGDYHLAAGSPYKGQATDGTDPGANIDAVVAATQ